jgi:DNA-directed RNA polymerase specialized sigma24 family protein
VSNGSDSIGVWIDRLRQNDPQAARVLWDRFYPRMVAVASRRLGSRPRRVSDEEDAALGAFADFDRAVKAGRFPDLRDANGLWALLLTFTVRKVQEQVRHDARAARGGGLVRGDSAVTEEVPASPDEGFVFQDTLEGLLAELESDQVRAVALDKLEGWTNDEIAGRQSCSRATVERRLRLVRETWRWLLDGESEPA